MADCFLIADEVGLGKTIVARTILCEMARLKSGAPVHAIYVASNEALARQNMEKEFLSDYGSQKENYEKLTGFQKATAFKALQVFLGSGYTIDSTSLNAANRTISRLRTLTLNEVLGKKDSPSGKDQSVRLSTYLPQMAQDAQRSECSTVMQLSPTTSFYNPKIKEFSPDSNSYTGSEGERQHMQNLFTKAVVFLKNNANAPLVVLESLPLRELIRELILAGIQYRKPKDLQELQNFFSAIIKDNFSSNSRFCQARRICSNAAAAMYRPDLIILDEFQRYRNVLEESERGYSVKVMYDYLKWRSAQKKDEIEKNYSLHFPHELDELPPVSVPKILLLSATPYNFNPDALKSTAWDSGDSYIRGESGEDPYQNFGELQKRMLALGADKTIRNQVARTERRFGDEKSDPSSRQPHPASDTAMLAHAQTGYLTPLIKTLYAICKAQNVKPKDIRKICRRAGSTPEFWRFNYGYGQNGVMGLSPQVSDALLAASSAATYKVDVFANLGLQQLKEAMFPTADALPQLWVPPVAAGCPGTGKTLVFTTLVASTRSVSYFCDSMAQKRIAKYSQFDAVQICPAGLTDIFSVCQKVTGKWPGNKLHGDKLHDDKLQTALLAFFNRPFVKRVIAAHIYKANPIYAGTYSEAIVRYCKRYKFREMLEEFKLVAGSKADFEKVLSAALTHESSSLVETCQGSSYRFTNTDYTEMFVEDDAKSGNNNTKKDNSPINEPAFQNSKDKRTNASLDDICAQFNSPFYPMVLVARNSAQEGFNLQLYGDKLMHWQTAGNVNAFLQREGRLNRPGSLISRHKVWQWAQWCSPVQVAGYSHAKAIFDAQCQTNATRLNLSAHSTAIGLAPLWTLKSPEGDVTIRQILPLSQYNDVYDVFMKQLISAERYASFNPDLRQAGSTASPMDLCPFYDKEVKAKIAKL